MNELIFTEERHKKGAEIFTVMGTFAPAMGMLGTLIGLVQMLRSMDNPDAIRSILENELIFTEERHKKGAEIFTVMGTFSPAMGMLGTLIGLVQMLRSMDNPDAIGPGMAVALITTFYGSILANLMFLPVAGKLKFRREEEVKYKQLIIEGISSIQVGDNPRVVEQKLYTYLSPSERTELPAKPRE